MEIINEALIELRNIFKNNFYNDINESGKK